MIERRGWVYQKRRRDAFHCKIDLRVAPNLRECLLIKITVVKEKCLLTFLCKSLSQNDELEIICSNLNFVLNNVNKFYVQFVWAISKKISQNGEKCLQKILSFCDTRYYQTRSKSSENKELFEPKPFEDSYFPYCINQ